MPVMIFTFLISLLSFSAHAADITSARFVEPTERYKHCVLGDCTEFGGVEVTLDDGSTLAYRLDGQSVFEDLTPRLVPLGLNRRNAVLAVRSYLDKGASLVLLDQKGGQLQIVAESEAIGTPHRWQNPIGVANFDRDGKLEIATVITPHLGGTLTLYERRGNKLVKDKTAYPVSNHKSGSEILDLHEIIDWDKDGVMDIVIPDVTHRELRVISFANDKGEVIDSKTFNLLVEGPITPVASGVEFIMSDENKEIWLSE